MTKQYDNTISNRCELGKSIKYFRSDRGMSQRELAEAAHITYSNLANIELGKYSVGLDILSMILDALDCELNIEKRK